MTSKYINKIYLDRYKVLEEIQGTNDYELSFKGKDLQTDKTVLLRIIPIDKEHPELREQSQHFIFKELGLLQRLHHEGLPTFLDSFNSKEENVIITEYREGLPLIEKLKTKAQFSEQETLDFIEKLLPILQYLHNQTPPIIYRDLQPNSIFFDKNGHLFLTKYEAARTYKADKIKDTVVVSTRGYNPPEQALGKGQSDARSDLYSVGMIAFQMLTGKDPTASLILPKVSDIRADVSSVWTTLVSKATNIKPDKRYTSVEDLLIDIYRIKGVSVESMPKPATPAPMPQRPTAPVTVQTSSFPPQGAAVHQRPPMPGQQPAAQRPAAAQAAVPQPMQQRPAAPQAPAQPPAMPVQQRPVPQQPVQQRPAPSRPQPPPQKNKQSWLPALITIIIIAGLGYLGLSLEPVQANSNLQIVLIVAVILMALAAVLMLRPKNQ